MPLISICNIILHQLISLNYSLANLDDYCPVENHKEQTGSSINLKLSLNRKKNIKSKLKLKKKELKKNMFQSESNKWLIDQIFVPSSLSRVPSHLITTRDSKEDSFDDQKTAENMNSNRLNSMFEATAEKRPLTSYNITYDHRK